MSKTKIEDLPRLEDLDPEDQRLIRGGKPSIAKRRSRPIVRPAPIEPEIEEDIIISRIPPEA